MKFILPTIGVLGSVFVAQTGLADISDTVRRRDAVALYEFKDFSGNTVKDTSAVAPALDLAIARPSDFLTIAPSGLSFNKNRNQIYSTVPATKIINACKASNEMTLEVWIENGPSAELYSGQYPAKIPQPQRILSLSKGINQSSFTLGQFYDGTEKDQYMVGVRNNGQGTTRVGEAVLSNAVTTKQNEIIIPSFETNPANKTMQKLVFTLSKGQIASLYVTDRKGTTYISQTTQKGFTSTDPNNYFSNWDADARLVLGNEYFSDMSKFNSEPSVSCQGDNASKAGCESPNRYWGGKLYLVAIYCRALAKEEIFGSSAYQIVQNPALDIDLSFQISPTLVRAQNIYQRLTGVKTPIVNPVLKDMEKLLILNDTIGAAAIATSQASFYNITVRDFASRMSNRDETINTPLNDFTATVIGAVRDETSAKSLLTDNMVYVGDTSKASVPSDDINDILKSNNHYQALDTGRFDLSKVLVRTTQKVFDGKGAVENPTPAGLLTTRQWASAHAIAGTQRRMVEYTFREFLCTPIDRVADNTGPDNVIGRDIDRFPGGSYAKFTSTCRACHTIMDGFRPAFSQITFNSNMLMNTVVMSSVKTQEEEDMGKGVWTSDEPGASYVIGKLNKNKEVFPSGRVTSSDAWVNNAIFGSNLSTFEWKQTSGKGVADFGKLISESSQFPRCMAQRVFKSVCKRDPASSEDNLIKQAATEFATNRNFNLKYLFQKIATSDECLGSN